MPRRIFQGRSLLALLLGLLAMVVAADSAWAQTGGQLRVVVSDEDELSLPGVSLELTSDSLIGGLQRQETNASGEALFVELPPGQYRLAASMAGFGGVTYEGIQININRTAIQAVTLVSGAVEELEVKAKAKAVDTESTAIGQVLTKEFLQRIPAGRTYQNAVQTVPGVTGGANPNMGGGASNENTYMLDGANITDPVTGTFSVNFNFDAIEQIEVILGGYMPEYGQAIGGVINVVTESGTNNLQLQTNIFYNNGNLAPKTDERLAADGVQLAPTQFDSQFQTLQIAQKLSGPLIRDKAWFVVSYQNSRTLIGQTGIPQPRDFDGHYILAKLTVQPNTEHRLSLFIQSNPTTIDNTEQFNPRIQDAAQGRQAQGGYVANLRWQWFLAPDMNIDTALLFQKIFIEANAVPCTHNRDRDWHPCRPGEMEGYVDWETPGRVGAQGSGAYDSVNYGIYLFDDRFRYTASSKLSLLSVSDPLGGTHDLKFGIEGNQLVWDQIFGYSGNTLYVDTNQVSFDPQSLENFYWLEITGPIKYRTTASEYNAFAQDSWKPVSNLTINYGSRFDAFVFRNDLGEPVLSGALLGPRLFGSWDPFGDQRTKIATGYGRFNDTGRLSVAGYTGAAAFGQKLYLGEGAGAGGEGAGFLNSQSNLWLSSPQENLNVAHDRLRAPRVDELLLTIEREIIQDVALYSTMSGKFTRHLYEPDDRNLIWDSDGSIPIGSRFAEADQIYGRLRSPALAKRDYFRWDLGARKVESRRWAAQASYSYTQSVGSSTQSLSGSFLVDPRTQFNYGPLNTDIQHTARAYAYWDVPTDPWTIQLSALFIYNDGFPIERLYISEGPNFVDYSLRIRPRGTYLRFNPTWTLNVGYTQFIDVRKGQFLIRFEALNLLNNRSPQTMFFDPGAGGFLFLNTQNRLVTGVRQNPLQLQGNIGYRF